MKLRWGKQGQPKDKNIPKEAKTEMKIKLKTMCSKVSPSGKS